MPHPAIRAALGVVCAVCAICAGCSPRAQSTPAGVDCTAESPYEIHVYEDYESGRVTDLPGVTFDQNAISNPAPWYSYGDGTPGATNDFLVASNAESGACPSMGAFSLLLESHGHNDYGSGFGTYSFAGLASTAPIDVSAYEGISFWARSWDPRGAPTSKGVTLEIGDKDTFNPLQDGGTYVDGGCVNGVDAGYLGNGASIIYVGGATGGGAAVAHSPPGTCGNSFTYPLVTTDHWQLYTIPFSSFNQGLQPNRVSTGFDPTTFAQVLVIAPSEAAVELWIDNIGFYRHKPPEAGP